MCSCGCYYYAQQYEYTIDTKIIKNNFYFVQTLCLDGQTQSQDSWVKQMCSYPMIITLGNNHR